MRTIIKEHQFCVWLIARGSGGNGAKQIVFWMRACDKGYFLYNGVIVGGMVTIVECMLKHAFFDIVFV